MSNYVEHLKLWRNDVIKKANYCRSQGDMKSHWYWLKQVLEITKEIKNDTRTKT